MIKNKKLTLNKATIVESNVKSIKGGTGYCHDTHTVGGEVCCCGEIRTIAHAK